MDITEKQRIDDQGKKVKPMLTDEQYCILYAVCHMTGMLSACANPVIYGYLNENFNREFKEIFGGVKRACCCCCRDLFRWRLPWKSRQGQGDGDKVQQQVR